VEPLKPLEPSSWKPLPAESATAGDTGVCHEIFSEPRLKIDACLETPAKLTVNILFRVSNKTVTAIFDTREKEAFWERLWFSNGEPMLTEQEQGLIQDWLKTSGGAVPWFSPATDISQENSARVRKLLDFLANFLEPDTPMPPFERQSSRSRFKFRLGSTYTMICDAVGLKRQALFSAGAQKRVMNILVGDPDTRCRGRCGAGCQQWGQWNANQYTQECLNHDVCRDETGEQFGPCEDEFWIAAYGYVFAPDCPPLPQPLHPRFP